MLRGNKGEWSEVYVLLKLLVDGKLHAADQDLHKIENIFYPILKIIRKETKGEILEYYPGEEIKIFLNGEKLRSISAAEIDDQRSRLLESLMTKKGSFALTSTEEFLKKLGCFKLSAPSSQKSDIILSILDINTGFSPTVGFSIKSELGSPPTLLNAGRTTNFIYHIEEPNPEIIMETNNIYRVSENKQHINIKGRLANLVNSGSKITYHGMQNETFRDNLILIDSNMDRILAETLLYFYRDSINRCADLVKLLEQENPLGYGNVHAYSYKFKTFLTSVALGMRPATKWDGTDEASGGYIIVTKSGGVVAYHIYNRNHFQEYLLQNTKYETASTSRHQFGELYTENGKTLLKLNLQIRFV